MYTIDTDHRNYDGGCAASVGNTQRLTALEDHVRDLEAVLEQRVQGLERAFRVLCAAKHAAATAEAFLLPEASSAATVDPLEIQRRLEPEWGLSLAAVQAVLVAAGITANAG